ncbi:MAG: hypothetical protein QQN41_04100 [Nitrosopumilus sp.]
MKTQTENQTENVAEKNQTHILNGEKINDTSKEISRLSNMAYQNENDIAYSAKTLESNLKRGIQRLTETLQYLREGTTGLLGACGVMQGLNHDIDVEITKIQSGIKNRAFYSNLIK